MDEQGREVVFHSMDRDADIEISNRNLPHWFQVDTTIFVTFRTHDSMPSEVLVRWRQQLEQWLAIRDLPIELADSTVNRKLPNHEQIWDKLSAIERREFRKMSDRIFHYELDKSHGSCPFRNVELANIVSNAILHGNGEQYDLDSFIVMPNHVHALVQFRQQSGLAIVSQSWMRYTARQINNKLGRSGPLWQPEPFDHLIRSSEQFCYLQNYIADNPRKAGLEAGEFLYWRR